MLSAIPTINTSAAASIRRHGKSAPRNEGAMAFAGDVISLTMSSDILAASRCALKMCRPYQANSIHFGRTWMSRIHPLSLLALALSGLVPITAFSAGTLTVEREAVINAPPQKVWKMIGEFNHLDVWHPAVASSTLAGSGTNPGDVRTLTLGDGATITEKLVAIDNSSYTYSIETSPLPVDHYVSTLSVKADDGGGSIVKWSSSFDAKGAPDDTAKEVIAGIYDAGLGRLSNYFNGK
jgi:mxaD protein